MPNQKWFSTFPTKGRWEKDQKYGKVQLWFILFNDDSYKARVRIWSTLGSSWTPPLPRSISFLFFSSCEASSNTLEGSSQSLLSAVTVFVAVRRATPLQHDLVRRFWRLERYFRPFNSYRIHHVWSPFALAQPFGDRLEGLSSFMWPYSP